MCLGGSGEIRTHERLTPSAVFKTAAFNHSATLPVHGIIHNHRLDEGVLTKPDHLCPLP